MGQFIITWREILIVVILMLAVYVAELIWFMGLRKRDKSQSAPQDQVDQELAAVKTKLAELKQEVEHLHTIVEQLKNAQYAHPRYGQAIQMAQQGLDVNQIADGCEISRSEAELVVALYSTPAA